MTVEVFLKSSKVCTSYDQLDLQTACRMYILHRAEGRSNIQHTASSEEPEENHRTRRVSKKTLRRVSKKRPKSRWRCYYLRCKALSKQKTMLEVTVSPAAYVHTCMYVYVYLHMFVVYIGYMYIKQILYYITYIFT